MSPMALEVQFLKSLKVLYVEDDPDDRAQVSDFLRRRVGSLALASHGAAGLEAFHDRKPDLVITDIRMPVMDGLEMMREIRRAAPSMPMIVTTAFEHSPYVMRAIELGVDQYVMKPVQSDRLEAALLACAYRLMAEDERRRRQDLELEILRTRHDAAINTLLTGIGHDYGNLLQAILGTLDLATVLVTPGSQLAEIIETGRQAGAQMRLLSRRLGSLVGRKQPLDRTAPVVELLRRTAERELEGSRVQTTFDGPEADPPILHNEPDLAQVFTHLVVNAREAMPEGGTLRIRTWVGPLSDQDPPALAPGTYLHLSLRDDGKGIAAEDLPMIFEPYFTTKKRGVRRGEGLGLALCEAILREHGGSIRAESRLGEGTEIQLLLPVLSTTESQAGRRVPAGHKYL